MKKSTRFLTFLMVFCLLVPLALTACGSLGGGAATTTESGSGTPSGSTSGSGDEPGSSSDATSGSEPDSSSEPTSSSSNNSSNSSSSSDSSSNPEDTADPSALAWAFGQPVDGTLPAESSYKAISDWGTPATFTVTNNSTTTTYYGFNAFASCFALGGITNPKQNSDQYYRLDYANSTNFPGSLDTSTNKGSGVAYLATQTAGVTVRFCTDATTIAIKAVMQNCNTAFNHMPLKGVYGFDVYVGTGTNRTWVTTTANQLVASDTMTGTVKLPSGYKEVMICFPQYGGVTEVKVGFPATTSLLAKPTNRTGGTVAFYGTSITQGACSSRAGTSYTNILGRALDADIRNLGFSGSAKGEQSVAEYIAGLTGLTAFVMDYDRNNGTDADGQANLKATHYPFYQTVRAAHPDIPIIFVTRPVFTTEPTSGDKAMYNIVLDSYNKAVAAGDTNVYLVNGLEFFTDGMEDTYTVDGTHPNDTGHFFMASKIFPVLKAAMDK